MARYKSASKKRDGGLATPKPPADMPIQRHSPIIAHSSTPLKSLLRVRLPPAAKNGTAASIYSPEGGSSFGVIRYQETSKASSKRVRIVAGTSPSDPLPSGKNKQRSREPLAVLERAAKERRLSDSSFPSPRRSNWTIGDSNCESNNSVAATPSWMRLGTEYVGCCPFKQTEEKNFENLIPRVDYTKITAKEFFDQFVCKRRPCIILVKESSTLPQTAEEMGSFELTSLFDKWVSNDYLKKATGSANIDVEIRDTSLKQSFGEGRKTHMQFGALLDLIENGEEQYYVTTQSIKESAEGPVAFSGQILSETDLFKDYPNIPSIMGNLIPHQHNVWIGNSKTGSSTGLHHDFHDNLYVMIRGVKKFRLYSPRCAEVLRTVGTIQQIHSNGLIAYDKYRRSDGALEADVLRWRAEQAQVEINVLKTRLEAIDTQILKLDLLIKRIMKLKWKDKGFSKFKDLGSKHMKAIAQEFFVSSKLLSPCCLQTELNSKLESKKLVSQYIEDALKKKEMFLNLREELILEEAQSREEAFLKSSDTSEGGDSIDQEMFNYSSNGDENQIPDNILSENIGSLNHLESSMDLKTKNDINELRSRILSQVNISSSTWEAKNESTKNQQSENVTKIIRYSKTEEGSTESDTNMEIEDGNSDWFDDSCNLFADKCQIRNLSTSESFHEESKPLHFCEMRTLDRSQSPDFKELPDGPDVLEVAELMKEHYLEVTLRPREMLYLPASWFHEVISVSSDPRMGHMAFNYWFYPPATPSVTFNEPYIDEYWPKHYRRILEIVERERETKLIEEIRRNPPETYIEVLQLLQSGVSPQFLASLPGASQELIKKLKLLPPFFKTDSTDFDITVAEGSTSSVFAPAPPEIPVILKKKRKPKKKINET